MSTKRGRRNGKWHKEKANRRLQQKRDELWEQSLKAEYIPLEKPIFAGWDISIGLTELGRNRKDSDELQAVLDILKLSNYYFTSNVNVIKNIRRNNYDVKALYHVKYPICWELQHLTSRHIHNHVFLNLPDDFKKWFSPDRYYKYSDFVKPYYVLYNFPWYACRLVITKSYYNYRKVYDTVAKSEYDKLDSYLYTVDRKTWGNYWRDSFSTSNKNRWKESLREITKKQYKPEEIIDKHPVIFRRTECKKDFGWT